MGASQSQKKKAKHKLSTAQTAEFLRNLASELESGVLSFPGQPGELSDAVEIKEASKTKSGKISYVLELELELTASVPDLEPEKAGPELQAPDREDGPEALEQPAESADMPSETESAPEPEATPENYAQRTLPSSYKKLKKRMAADFRKIKKSLEAGEMPPADLVQAFYNDCLHMTSFPGKGDPNYEGFNQTARDLLQAANDDDAQKAAQALAGLDQMKKDCHKEYK